MLNRRRNAGLKLNSTGERGSTVTAKPQSVDEFKQRIGAQRENAQQFLAELLEKRERDSRCCHTCIFTNFRFVSRPVVKLAVWTLNFRSGLPRKMGHPGPIFISPGIICGEEIGCAPLHVIRHQLRTKHAVGYRFFSDT